MVFIIWRYYRNNTFLIFTILIACFLDAFDGEFASKRVLSRDKYQLIDKILDTWMYLLALSLSWIFINKYFLLLLVLFIYRMIGQLLALITKDEKMFLISPNLFGNFFLLLIFGTVFPSTNVIQGQNLYISLLAVGLFTLYYEYCLHIKKFSLLKDVFGLKIKKQWLKS